MSGTFDGLDPTRQGDSIIKGAERIERVARQRKESEYWSIAELRLAADDIAWLSRLTQALLPDQTELNLQYSTRSPKFGLLFLAFAAEVCRRETEESEAWPIIRNIGWKPDVQAVLFNKQGAAKPLLCQAIEAACLQYRLRNIIGQQGKMYWFTTIKLQFGLTRSGLTEQLGRWLYLDTLPSVARLLLQDPENRSESFTVLIEALEAYQDGFKPEEELRAMLIASPWILEDWVEDVLAAARRRPAVATRDRRVTEQASHSPEFDDSEQLVACVREPSLVWNTGTVEFVASVRDEIDELCSSDRFFVSVEDEAKALFIQQGDGGFVRAGGRDREIQFGARTPNVRIAITDETSEPVAVELVPLFDPSADLEAWTEGSDGRSQPVDVATHSFQPSRPYTFCVSIDAEIEGVQNAILDEWTHGAQKWIRLPRGWSPNLRIVLDELELLASGELQREVDRPAWVDSITMETFDVDWDRGEFRLRGTLPPDVRVLGVRVLGQAIRIHQDMRKLESDPVPMRLYDAKGVIDARIAAVRENDRRVIRLKPRLPIDGLLFNLNGRWQRHSPNLELNVGGIRRTKCVVQPPNPPFGQSSRECVAIQGFREVGAPKNRPGLLRGLAGWGQVLELAEGRFNRPAGDQRVRLASRVVDRGCVLDCVQMAAADNVFVRLQDPIEPSSEHSIVVWTSEGHLVGISHADMTATTDASDWQFKWSSGPEYSRGIVAIAVAYRGMRLGAWWVDDWCHYIRYHIDAKRAKEVAARMRWFQLPILDRRHAGDIQAIVRAHGLAFAEAWLVWCDDRTQQHLAETGAISAIECLRPPTADPAWYEVIREMLADWNPQPDDAKELDRCFEQTASKLDELTDCLPLASLVERVAEAAPLLTGRLVRQWLLANNEFANQASALLDALASYIAPRAGDPSASEDLKDFDVRIDGLPLAGSFFEEVLQTAQLQCNRSPVGSHAAENLQSLLQHPNVARLVAAHLLDSLKHG